MRVNGAWLPGDDGVIRPIVPGLVRLPDGQWLEVSFLLDAGADRTVFSADFFSLLEPLETPSQRVLLSGVGGTTNSITIETAIEFGFVFRDAPCRNSSRCHNRTLTTADLMRI